MDVTSDEYLEQYLKKYKIKCIIKSKDDFTINDIRNNTFFIFNLSDDPPGTHWTAFYKKGKNIYYMDSFGEIPPQDLKRLFDKYNNIYCNASVLQNIDESDCGYFCLLFLLYMKKYKNVSGMDKFINSFDVVNTEVNRKLLFNQLSKFKL